jgi:hypothetical protein
MKLTSDASLTSVVEVKVLVVVDVDAELLVVIEEAVSLLDRSPLVPRSMPTASSVFLR